MFSLAYLFKCPVAEERKAGAGFSNLKNDIYSINLELTFE